MLRDVRHAFRVLFQSKGWTLVVLVSLALGIGANTALFSAVNAMLMQALAVEDPDGLVRLRWAGENPLKRNSSEYGYAGETADGQRVRTTFSFAAFEELRNSSETLDGLFAAAPYWQVNVVVAGEAEIASGFIASGRYFDVLGVRAARGRTIGPDDDRPGAAPVVMISYEYWQRRFGLDPAVVGKEVTVNNVPVTIVGVTPAGYGGIQRPGGEAADVHLPLALDPRLGGGERLSEPANWWLQVMGRLRPGATRGQVEGNLAGIFRAAIQPEPEAGDGTVPEVPATNGSEPPAELIVDAGRRGIYDPDPDTRRDVTLLGGVVVLVLLIVCANVANLLLSRATARSSEIAVRLSMGATRWRLVRQLLTESVVLSVLGGTLGLLVAFWARRLLPLRQDVTLDGRVFLFVLVLSLLTGLAFSLVPALRATRVEVSASLKDQSRGVAGGRTWLSRALLVAQVAVSLMLLMGAGLFLGTLRNLRGVDVGFDPSNVLLFRLDPRLAGYEGERAEQFYERTRERIAAVPGVRSVSLSGHTFLAGSTWTSGYHFQGSEETRSAHVMSVSPEFFETLDIRLLSGRLFDARDHGDALPVAIVNPTAVRELLDGGTAVGATFRASLEEGDAIEIVGVVNDVKYRNVRDEAPPTVYLPYLQSGPRSATFEVKTMSDPRSMVPAVREAIRAVDPHVPMTRISTQVEEIEKRFRQERYFALSYSLFGGLAMLLAAIGLFGLASYDVVRRTRELGIRMAMGARRADVLRLVLGESLRLAGLGVVLGVLGTLAAGRWVESLLYGVAPSDGLTMAAAALLLVLVTAFAGYLPARRAARVDPMVALQYE